MAARPKSGWIALGVVLALIVIVVLIIVGGYNNVISQREKVDYAWREIDVQLQARADKIPNLVATVKGYAAHESGIMAELADARAKLAGASTAAEKAQADDELSGALSRLLVVVENYPDLKADASFRQLSDEIAGAENRIAVARKDYNAAARAYNTTIKTFPGSMFASMANATPADYFEAAPSAQEAPKVEF